MLRRCAVIAGAGLVAGAMMLPGAAHADTFPEELGELLDTAADGQASSSTYSTFVNDTTIDLTWVADDAANAAGTSFETSNLGVDVAEGDVITVDYELKDDASAASNSVRLFVYYSPDADTWNDGPDQSAAAPDDGSTSGQLEIVASQDGTIGTMGLVYDTSNGGVEGTVRFSDLTVDGETILFQPPIPTEDPSEFFGSLACDENFEAIAEAIDDIGMERVLTNLGENIVFEPELTADHVEAFLERCAPDADDTEETEDPDEALADTSGLVSLPVLLGAGALLIVAGGALMLARRRNVDSIG